MCRLSRNPGALTLRTPQGHVGLFRGYFVLPLPYRLDGQGIEYREGGRGFPHASRPNLGLPTAPIQWVSGHFPGSKAAGAWRWSSTSSSVEVKERVELYLYSTYGPWWPVIGWTLPLLCQWYKQSCRWKSVFGMNNTGWLKKMDSISYVYISWTIHGMWMIYITFERRGSKF
jgi:hypothetical protein